MPKTRVIFLLSKPFDFTKEAKLQADAITKWAAKIRGVFASLGIVIDEACTDPSRLYYLPRHKKGRPFAINIYGGRTLDLDQIEGIEKGRRSTAENAFTRAGEKDAGKENSGKDPKRFYAPDGVDILRFVKERGDGFDIMGFFETYCPDRIRVHNGDKMTVECPFDENHSRPGDPDGPGCFIASAVPHEDRKFAFKCMHTHCVDLTPAELLAEACHKEWFQGKDLFDDQFDVLPRENPSELFCAAVEALSPGSGSPEIQAALAILPEAEPTATEITRCLTMIATKTGANIGDLRKDYKNVAARAVAVIPRIHSTGNQLKFYDDENYIEKESRAMDYFRNMDPSCVPYYWANGQVKSFEQFTGQFLTVSRRKFIAESTIWAAYVEVTGSVETVVHPDERFFGNLYERAQEFLPVVEYVTSSPVFAPDGTVYCTFGYHPAIKTFITSHEFDQLEISSRPSDADVAGALSMIEEVFGDFGWIDHDDPLKGSLSYSTALALLMQPLLVRYFEHERPAIYAVVKSQPGAGATLLVQAIGTIINGAPYASQEYTDDPDELRKRLTASLNSGRSVIFYDNVAVKMTASALADFTTSPVWADRVLGESREVALKNNVHIVLTANKLRMNPDLARRTVFINLERRTPLGTETSFRHPRLIQWVKQNRVDLMRSLLVLLKAWAARRGPDWETRDGGPGLDGFERWKTVFCSLMDAIGLPGFRPSPPLESTVLNHGNSVVVDVLTAWYERFGAGTEVEAGRSGVGPSVAGTAREILEWAGVEVPNEGLGELSPQKLINWFKAHICDIKTNIETADRKQLAVQLLYNKPKNGKTKSTFKLQLV